MSSAIAARHQKWSRNGTDLLKVYFFTVGQLNECDQARLSKNSYLDAQTPAAAAAFIRAAFFERVVCCQGCQISCKCSEHLFAQNSLIRPPPIPACTQQD
jgi:hypothetical protein